MGFQVGLQLYTVRDVMAKDFLAGFREISSIGFRNVELAGLYNQSPEQFRDVLGELGLKAMSAHIGLDRLNDQAKLASVIAEARTIGYDLVVLPWLGKEYQTPEGYRQVAKVMDHAGKVLADAGLGFAYHNHAFEFEKLSDGSIGMDILYGQTNPSLVGAELDVYWVAFGGYEPAAFIQKLGSRVKALHIKDMAKTEQRGFAEVGTGTLDFKSILHAAKTLDISRLIVEQDSNWTVSPMESARVGFNNLSKLIG